jgi:hypothetical protein
MPKIYVFFYHTIRGACILENLLYKWHKVLLYAFRNI